MNFTSLYAEKSHTYKNHSIMIQLLFGTSASFNYFAVSHSRKSSIHKYIYPLCRSDLKEQITLIVISNSSTIS